MGKDPGGLTILENVQPWKIRRQKGWAEGQEPIGGDRGRDIKAPKEEDTRQGVEWKGESTAKQQRQERPHQEMARREGTEGARRMGKRKDNGDADWVHKSPTTSILAKGHGEPSGTLFAGLSLWHEWGTFDPPRGELASKSSKWNATG